MPNIICVIKGIGVPSKTSKKFGKIIVKTAITTQTVTTIKIIGYSIALLTLFCNLLSLSNWTDNFIAVLSIIPVDSLALNILIF